MVAKVQSVLFMWELVGEVAPTPDHYRTDVNRIDGLGEGRDSNRWTQGMT